MHTCPECGQACTCNGDFEDIMWDDSDPQAINCNHVLLEHCDDEAEEAFWFGEQDNNDPEQPPTQDLTAKAE